MNRGAIQLFIVLTILTVWLGGNAMAFTFGPGSVPASNAFDDPTVNGASDVPTPQLFRVAVSRNGVTLGSTPAIPKETPAVPDVRTQDEPPPRIASTPDTHVAQDIQPPRRLSGVELLLLRQTEMVAER
jgi:hypothetical protein